MSDICRVVPTPTPLALGGRAFLASELRISDVARIQKFINTRIPNPYELAAPVLESGDRSPGFKRLLSNVIDRLAEWPKEPGSPEADAILQSAEGRKLLIRLVLAREHPGFGEAEVDGLYDHVNRGDWGRLTRIAWGADPIRTIADLIDGPGDDEPGAGPDWGEWWWRYTSTAKCGPRFEDLTVSQFITFRCGGGTPSGPADLDDAVAVGRRRAAFFAGEGE